MPPSTPSHMTRRRAYTLIELLVVLTIIMILIAILIPVVSGAREQARTMLCAANMRQVSGIVNQFASQHDGRGPGQHCVAILGAQLHTMHYYDLLNDEVLGRGGYGFNKTSANDPATPYGIAGESANTQNSIGSSTTPKALSCPNYLVYIRPVGTPALTLPFSINYDLVGGTNFGGAAAWGSYGISVDPKQYPSNAFAYVSYSLGPKLIRFGPNQMLLVESDNTNFGRTSVGSRTTVGVLPLNDNPASNPPYSALNGAVSFRHPYSRKANFVHFDGHIELLPPTADIYSAKMYNLGS